MTDVKCREAQLDIEVSGRRRTTYYCSVPVEHTIEDVLSPEYFGALISSDRLTTGDIIKVEAADYSWYGELQVMGQEKSTRQCLTYQNLELKHRDMVEFPKDYSAEWLGDAEHYRILKGGDPISPPEAGFRSKEEAAVRAHVLAAKDLQYEAVRKATAKTAGKSAKKATEDA